MSDRNYLFVGGDLSASIEGHRTKMAAQIHALAPNQLLAAEDLTVCQHFVAEFTINPIELREEDLVLLEPHEVEVEEHSADFGRNFRRKLLEFRFELPFTGDQPLLKSRPSTWSSMMPRAQVGNGMLVFVFHRADRDGEAIKRELNEQLALVKQHLNWQRPDIDRWNQGLPVYVQQQVSARREKLIADKQLVADLGFRVRRRGDSAGAYTVPVQRKPVIPQLPSPRPGPATAPEPTLDAAVYEEILETLTGMSVVMERNPSAFATIDEETLRTHFLVPLNSNFRGMATGETFNAAGKTDILIKHEDRILFIAECKFWKGPQSLTDAITQLLSYTTWRETKTALLLFSRNKDFTSVLAQIPPVFAQHGQFVRRENYGKPTGFRFIVRSPHDPQRHLTITVLAFNVPVDHALST